MHISTYQTENTPCSLISWLLEHLPEVSYVVALCHSGAERQGGQEERIQQRFSVTRPEKAAASSCSPYTLKSKDPQSY